MTDNELTLTYIDGLMRGREEAAEQLSAAQAHKTQLQEALEDLHRAAKRTREMRCFVGEMENADEALALPHDDTALKARLKAERERVIALCDSGYWNDAGDLIRAIRTLGDE